MDGRRKFAALAAALLASGSWVGPAHADLAPAEGEVTVHAGQSATEDKVVTIPEFPAKADIEIAIDTTGSMAGEIAQAKAQASNLVAAVQAEVADAHFAVVQFKDVFDNPVYRVEQSLTPDAGAVQAAINRLSAGGGGDEPEAFDRVFHEAADPALGGDIGWRDGSRKFVVVIGDAPPHIAAGSRSAAAYPACRTWTEDAYETVDELEQLAAAQRTLFMVHAPTYWDIGACYRQLAASGFAGSQAAPLGSDISTQIVQLIKSASSTVSEVHLEVSAASPAPAAASWITFDPASATGPFSPGDTIDFTLTVSPPADTPAGTYEFSIVALADGGNIGSQRLTVVVTHPTCSTGLADGSGAPVLSEPGSVLNSDQDEEGPLSGQIHENEGELGGAGDVVHEANCTGVVTAEGLLAGG